jgi:hypothetical protein
VNNEDGTRTTEERRFCNDARYFATDRKEDCDEPDDEEGIVRIEKDDEKRVGTGKAKREQSEGRA